MIRLSLLLLLLSRPAYSMLLGWVESPGYPTGYLPHASLNWSRCAHKGHTLSIKLIHLDLEDSHDCENDAVKVFSNGNLISVLCGKREFEELQSTVNPSLLSSPGGCLSLTFHSDYSNTKRHTGFRGFYSDQDFDECKDDPDNGCTQFCHNYIGGYHCSCRHGYYLDVDKHTCTVSCTKDLSGLYNGDISSPSWPASYAENANCQYTLSVEATLQLELHFSEDFDVEQSPDGQCIDALRIETPSGILGPFCGHTPPPSPFLTHSHHVQIRFTSDGFGTNKGFSLHFRTRDKVCPAVVTSHSTVTPQQPEYHAGETVTVTCDLGYVVNTQGTQTLSSQYVAICQNTGVWTPNYVCEPVDCGFPDIPEDGILQLVGSDNPHSQYKDQIQFNCSSEYYTLEGDDLYICSANGEWVSGGDKTEMPKCIEVCGKPEKYRAARILGGQDANMGEIPWHLLIKEPNRGGASLINDRWAVTAAHVVETAEETSLRLYGGLVDGRTISKRFSNVVVMDSERIIIHPDYIKGIPLAIRSNFNNDIALIRLASRVNLGPNLLPICLPEVNRVLSENELGTVSGWGITESKKGAFHTSALLKYAHIGAYSLTKCQDTPSTPTTNERMTFTHNMFCAGADGKDSCQKDSGGPFVSPMLTEGSEPFRLTGIVSWGPPCQERKYKGYYTKVASYVDWIKETIDAIEKSKKEERYFVTLMFHLKVRHLLLQQRISSRSDTTFNPKMGWTFCIILFLYVSVCECRRLPDPEPVMHGAVQSPQYPQPYSPNLQEQWDLSVPEGYQIQITFTHLDIEASAGCHYDALTVLYDAKILGKFCGHENSADGHHPGNQPILSPGNRLTLVFQTDDNNPERHQNVGFSAQYQAIDTDECSAPEPQDGSGPLCSQICLNTLGSYLCACHHGYELRPDQRSCVLSCGGGIFDELEGHLFSPGYPNPPPQAVSCQYNIYVESGFTVALNFTDIFHIESVDTEQGPNCLYHWLQLTIPDREPMKLCGGKSPGLIVTNSNTVRLDYHTDDEGLSKGWSLDYSTYRVKCPFPGNVAKGRVTPILTEYFYRDYIFVRCEQGYKLMMDGEEVEGFSTMCQSDAKWHLPLPECHIIDCGEPEPLVNGGVTFLSGLQNQYRSVVQYHCNEPFYSLLGGINVVHTCEADRKWRPDNDIFVSPTCIPVCGQPTKLISAYQRIIGGSDAPDNTIPWQVLLSVDGARGGGMVIGDRWIMTAAHNLIKNGNPVSNETLRIYMGFTDATLLGSPVFAASIHIHPRYNNPSHVDYNNDIALIKMSDSVTFNSAIMPICLPAEGATYNTGTLGLVSGFGLTETNNTRILTNKMKFVQLPVVTQETCSNSIIPLKKTSSNVPSLTNNMFCAGVPEGGKDSCQGDSGGPYALRDNERFWAAGIVSWGIDCGKPGRYGVYTKVINYIDWINKMMQEN
ncbi:ovochymase [Cebidichthys violaceus]|uniref:ovochymase n=1 Tax=Cebidichthys violaceus TaxID=271503 RepID=UPI0035CBFDA5